MLSKIPTGCRIIDKVLDGGILSGSVNLIYGEAETGKTTLAMQCAANCGRQGYKTLFVDCDGMFSAKRLSQMTTDRFEEIGKLVILMRPNNFQEQIMIIDQMTDYVNEKLGLVVIDTITSLYRLKVAESPNKTFELNRELNRQLASLAQIARTQKVAVLVISQVRTAFKEDHVSIEPVATRVLKFWADTTINMNLTENPQIVKATVEKSSMKAQPVTCYLKLGESGIREYVVH